MRALEKGRGKFTEERSILFYFNFVSKLQHGLVHSALPRSSVKGCLLDGSGIPSNHQKNCMRRAHLGDAATNNENSLWLILHSGKYPTKVEGLMDEQYSFVDVGAVSISLHAMLYLDFGPISVCEDMSL